MNTQAPGAFFDVDETLISIKSMFSFLRYYLTARGEAEGTYERVTAALFEAAAAGTPREEINRQYYALYAGESAQRLRDLGREWYLAVREDPEFYHAPVRAALAEHLAAGPVYLVSGSFFPCLEPIQHEVGATALLCTQPVVRGGRLTGDVMAPMIAEAKARALIAQCAVRGLDRSGVSAYGDHASDLAMLEAVGDPVVVGTDPILTARAAEGGWRTLATRYVREGEMS